jgi:hypothetical protein
MQGLGMHRPDTFTYAHLHESVDKLAASQTVIDDPLPLLQATWEVLALAGVLRPHAQPFQFPRAEREVWDMLDDLKACYERDRGQIEAAHQLQTAQLVGWAGTAMLAPGKF